LSLALAMIGGCTHTEPPHGSSDASIVPDSGVVTDAGHLDDGAVAPDAGRDAPYLTALPTESAFDGLSGSLVGGELKYLARVAGRPPIVPLDADCYFQSARLYPWHLQFLQTYASLGASLSFDLYRELVVRETTRLMWGGTLRRWANSKQPLTGAAGVVSYDLYAEPGGLTVDRVAEVDQTLKRCAGFARERLAFVATGADQEQFVLQQRAVLASRGIASFLPSELSAGPGLVVYTRGESYGYLRVVPRGQTLTDYGPRDVVVVVSAPSDISVVSGLLTEKPQNELGHVNLRLREKAIPNGSLPGLYDADFIQLDGKLVHVVLGDQLSIVEANIDDAEAYWAAHRPTVRTPTADLTRAGLTPLRTLRASDAQSYGAKGANLGELTRVLEVAHRPDGFGIPFARYRDFMRAPELEAKLQTLLTQQAAGADAKQKRAALKALRDAIKKAPFDSSLLSALATAIETEFGVAGQTTYLRFRSSTNVEDLDSLTGAGLYDSKSGCLADDLDVDTTGPSACLTADKKADLERQREQRAQELRDHPDRTYLVALLEDIEDDLVHEKPVADSVRKVWASLWNERAFDERGYYGIDHRLAFMGIAVHPTYALERANAVVVSNLTVDSGAPLYRINSQVGELSVVTPEDPDAVAEVLTFRRQGEPPVAGDIKVVLGSSLLPPGSEVWPRDKLLELSQLLFRVHDHFAREVYPTLTPLSLDFEVKLERSGDVAIKQVRPYLHNDP